MEQICQKTLAEESTILKGGTVSQNEIHQGHTYEPFALIDDNFKTMIHSDTSDNNNGSKEFVINLASSYNIVSAFVVNRSDCCS